MGGGPAAGRAGRLVGGAPRRPVEAVRPAGAAHGGAGDRARPPPAARRQLRVVEQHLGRQHAAVGCVARLRLLEQGAHLLRGHPGPHHVHEAPHVLHPQVGILPLRVEQVLDEAFLDEPGQLRLRVGRGRDHDAAAHAPAGPGTRSSSAAPPAAAGPASRPTPPGRNTMRTSARVPAPSAAPRARRRRRSGPAGLARVAQGGQRPDRHVGPGDHERQLAEQFERRRVDVAGGGADAAQRRGDQIGREVVAPGARRGRTTWTARRRAPAARRATPPRRCRRGPGRRCPGRRPPRGRARAAAPARPAPPGRA